MKRFDRLRKTARKLATEHGHDLGFWVSVEDYYYARCIKCGKQVQMFPTSLPGSNMVDCSPRHSTAMKRVRSILYTRMVNQEIGLTDRAGGTIIGKPLTEKCTKT